MLLRRTMRWISLLLLTACNSQPIGSRLAECDLLTEGEIGPRIEAGFYAPNDCYRECLASASCDELQAAICRTDLDLLLRCDARCAFHCSDGSLVAVEAVCDGRQQCADGGDEAGCPPFRCDDGTEVSAGARCNGWLDCAAGEDESSCAEEGVFCTTDWGTTFVGVWGLCDGYSDCHDLADERGCSEHVCADGTVITHRPEAPPRCNGSWQCLDRSDEMGCAELDAMCGL